MVSLPLLDYVHHRCRSSRIGFPEMPDLNLKVTPVFGESKYSYTLIHDFLEARIRDELKVSTTCR